MPQQYLIQGMTGDETFEQWFNKTNEIVNNVNDKNGVVKIELDYSDPLIAGQPETNFSHLVNGNISTGFGFTVGQPLFNVSIANNTDPYDVYLDFVHCNLVGKITGTTGFGLVSFNNPGDAWGSDGGGGTNLYWQRSLFGLVSKIYSWDFVNKKIVMDVIRPGGNAVIKYGDLNGYSNRNWKTFYDNVLSGGSFFLGTYIHPEEGGSQKFGFFHITPHCGYADGNVGWKTLYWDDIHYLTIIPYNDVDQNLNIYLDPRAPNHKLTLISGLTAAIQRGSCEITGQKDKKEFPLNNIEFPETPETGTLITTVGYDTYALYEPKNKFQTALLKITCLLQGQTYSRRENTGIYLTSHDLTDPVYLYEGGNLSSVTPTNASCDPVAFKDSCTPGYVHVGFCPGNKVLIVNKFSTDEEIKVCVTPII